MDLSPILLYFLIGFCPPTPNAEVTAVDVVHGVCGGPLAVTEGGLVPAAVALVGSPLPPARHPADRSDSKGGGAPAQVVHMRRHRCPNSNVD